MALMISSGPLRGGRHILAAKVTLLQTLIDPPPASPFGEVIMLTFFPDEVALVAAFNALPAADRGLVAGLVLDGLILTASAFKPDALGRPKFQPEGFRRFVVAAKAGRLDELRKEIGGAILSNIE